MKKKVLFIPSWYPSAENPINGVFIQEQATALAQKYDVAVLLPELAAWRNVAKPDSSQKSRVETKGTVPVYYEYALPLIPHGPESIDYQTFVRAAQKGYKKLVKEFGKPDVIHAHVVLHAGWCALQVGLRNETPVVLTEHSSPFSMHLDTEVKRKLVRQTLKGVNKIVAVSPSLADQILAFEPDVDINVIGDLVSTEFFTPGPSQNGHSGMRFFAAGRLAQQKGLNYLLQAMQILKRRHNSPFELLLGGDGPDRESLQQLATELGVADRCRFLGMLDRSQVRTWLQQSDVFVLSSLHETFGIVVGEAMACGKPVIATRCGGPEFILTDKDGMFVDVKNSEQLADAMSQFILGQVSYDRDEIRSSVVNRFGTDAFVENISAVYESVW